MDTSLYKLSEENIETLLHFFNLIKEKSEKYYSFLNKFNKTTKSYCQEIKSIFGNEIIFIDDTENIKKENAQNLKKRGPCNIKISIDINESITKLKTIDISPIEYNIERINKLFKNYYECLELFTRSLENQMNSLYQNIEKTKVKINEIKNNYSIDKQTFLQKYSEYDAINKKLYNKYFEQEKYILDFTLKNKPQITKEKETELINKLFDTLKNEKELKTKFKKLENFGKIFNDSYEKNSKELKEIVKMFYNQFETLITHIFIFYGKSFLIQIKDFTTDKNNMKTKEKDFDEKLNHSMKKIEAKSYEFNLDDYKVKTIKINSMNENNITEGDKILINMVKNSHKKIDEKDIFFIVKKMYNFQNINKTEYIIDIEKEKLNLNERLNKLFNFAYMYNIKKNNDKINDINSNSNSENKGATFEENTINKKESEPTQEDLDYICKLMNRKEYRDFLLTKLNNYRAVGSLIMPENIYNYFVQIFLEIIKYIIDEKKTDTADGSNIDYITARYIFILSQTFYYKKDGKKIYLQNGLKNQKIFQSAEFWINLLQNNMKMELEKLSKNREKPMTENDIQEKGNEICLMQILPYLSGFTGFGMSKEEINRISDFFIKEYKLNEEAQKIIFESIQNYENNL